MNFDPVKIAGLLICLGSGQFMVAMVIAESVYPGYSVSGNFISDLGVGPAAGIFNTSIALVGIAFIAATYLLRLSFLQGRFRRTFFPLFAILGGLGAIGVGVFPETSPTSHATSAFVAFLFIPLAAIFAYWLVKPPLNFIGVALGILALIALGLFLSRNFAGLGVGGMERMIVYPVILWGIAFGGHLLGEVHPSGGGSHGHGRAPRRGSRRAH